AEALVLLSRIRQLILGAGEGSALPLTGDSQQERRVFVLPSCEMRRSAVIQKSHKRGRVLLAVKSYFCRIILAGRRLLNSGRLPRWGSGAVPSPLSRIIG